MAKGPNTRRQPARSMAEIDSLIAAGAYDRVPLNPQGAEIMRQRVQQYGGLEPGYGNTSGQLRSAYETDLPDNVYGPQLPDLYLSAQKEARDSQRYVPDPMSQDMNRDKNLYRANMAIATRRAEGIDPAIEWRSGVDASAFQNNAPAVMEQFTPNPEITPMQPRPMDVSPVATEQGLTPEMVRLKMRQKMGPGSL